MERDKQTTEICYVSCIFEQFYLLNSDGDIDFKIIHFFLKQVNDHVFDRETLAIVKQFFLPIHLNNTEKCISKR